MDKVKPLKLLMLGHYPLLQLNRAPMVRIHYIHQALTRLCQVDLLSDTRKNRRYPLLKLILSGKYKQYDFVYIEAATSTSMEVDLLHLVLCWLKGIPTGIYIRDAYPMFGLTPKNSFKNRLLILAWYISIWFYQKFATVLFFQSTSLAKHFHGNNHALLPPGGEKRARILRRQPFHYILHAGSLNVNQGSQILLNAMDIVHQHNPDLKLLLLCERSMSDIPPEWEEKVWLDIREGSMMELKELFPTIAFGIFARPQTLYNHMILPVKLFDYMSLGLPIMSTACKEIKAFITEHHIGCVTEDQPQAMAQAIINLLEQPDRIQEMGERAYHLIQTNHSWEHRAEKLLNVAKQYKRV